MVLRFLLFLLVNFAALGLGSLFTAEGVSSEWYQTLSKAPWTPPGWVFGAAWTTIMICFSLYMANLWNFSEHRVNIVKAFAWQWIFNVSWNPIFFKHHLAVFGLMVILSLTVLVAFFFFRYLRFMKFHAIWILPYLIWLLIATSLNAYIVFAN